MGFVKEFREFALKGNVLDLAVGVIIGGAFGLIVNSMVKDLIMPVVGLAGNADFSNMYMGLTESTRNKIDAATNRITQADGTVVEIVPRLDDARAMGPILAYGNFITVAINFIILAFCIFLIIKLFNTARKKFEKEKAAAPPPGPTASEVLLTEIRDELRARRG
ncbi:MAG: large conductance mechanosensitive channel protein MscL [Phycisphaeraceae bacterium]|nr:large conductance mechanosensitive channel protein MscL [Phycisphaeraceae bacterium]